MLHLSKKTYFLLFPIILLLVSVLILGFQNSFSIEVVFRNQDNLTKINKSDSVEKALSTEQPSLYRVLKKEFINRFGNQYGYSGRLENEIIPRSPHLTGQVYLDYTGAGVYAGNVLDSIYSDLSTNLYGNAHSRAPSSLNTENRVHQFRKSLLNYFGAPNGKYIVIFTSGTTQSLKMVGESFPWESSGETGKGRKSIFAYHDQCHNSVLGIRNYSKRFADGFQSLSCEKLVDLESMFNDGGLLETSGESHSLFAFPAQSNFDGIQFDLDMIDKVQSMKNWHVILDAAAFVPTNRLDLNKYSPHFVAISFYKMIGIPTGLGALLVHEDAVDILEKTYFGGGTVIYASECTDFCKLHPNPSIRFEDGTLNFLGIVMAQHSLDFANEIGIDAIHAHVSALTHFLFEKMNEMVHSNGVKMLEIYGNHQSNPEAQGGIISFNIKDKNGDYVGYFDVQEDSANANIHLRTGCHCNPGGCSRYLKYSPEEIEQYIVEKQSCSDEIDILDGKPLGAVRVSLGAFTTFEDLYAFLEWLEMTYLEKSD